MLFKNSNETFADYWDWFWIGLFLFYFQFGSNRYKMGYRLLHIGSQKLSIFFLQIFLSLAAVASCEAEAEAEASPWVSGYAPGYGAGLGHYGYAAAYPAVSYSGYAAAPGA